MSSPTFELRYGWVGVVTMGSLTEHRNKEEQGGRPSKVRKYAIPDREWRTKTTGSRDSNLKDE